MKDYCLELAAKQTVLSAKYNIMREYTQAYVLKIMQEAGCFRYYAFVGGTALRFLYDLPRFSEDLDFSSVKAADAAFADIMVKIKKELTLAGYQVGITYSDDKAVHSAFIKFEELLLAAGLSPLKSEKFSIKIEIDIRPPAGAVVVTRVVNKFFPLAFLTYDLPSLFSGKIHAVLSRKYAKGRDYYDIAWYLSRHKELRPNFILLSAALKQSGWQGEPVTGDNWRDILAERIEQTEWAVVSRDIHTFLERPEDMQVMTKENVILLVKGAV